MVWYNLRFPEFTGDLGKTYAPQIRESYLIDIKFKNKTNLQSVQFSSVAQLCPTLCDPIDGSPPGFLSLGFFRQEHWSGLPFPSPVNVYLDLNWEVFSLIFVCFCLSTTLLLFFKDFLALVVKMTRLIAISYEKLVFPRWQFFRFLYLVFRHLLKYIDLIIYT